MRIERRGFTIIEAMLALALGAIVLLNARLFVDQVERAGHRIQVTIADRDEQANGLRLARRLLANVFQPADSASRLRGTPVEADAASWCSSIGGTSARCRVSVWITRGAASSNLVLRDAMSNGLLIASLTGEARLLYADVASSGMRRIESEWVDRDELPRAILFASIRDTITFAVGSR